MITAHCSFIFKHKYPWLDRIWPKCPHYFSLCGSFNTVVDNYGWLGGFPCIGDFEFAGVLFRKMWSEVGTVSFKSNPSLLLSCLFLGTLTTVIDGFSFAGNHACVPACIIFQPSLYQHKGSNIQSIQKMLEFWKALNINTMQPMMIFSKMAQIGFFDI